MAETLSPWAVATMDTLTVGAKLLFAAIFVAARHPGAKDIPHDIEGLGARIGLTSEETQVSLEELIDKGFVKRFKEGD
jgi:hypothetical protein